VQEQQEYMLTKSPEKMTRCCLPSTRDIGYAVKSQFKDCITGLVPEFVEVTAVSNIDLQAEKRCHAVNVSTKSILAMTTTVIGMTKLIMVMHLFHR
jgi:hypothetical protein